MKIKKVYQKRFTTVDNTVLNDTKLSWKAKGLFVYLWSQADEWEFYETEVVKHSADGIASLKAGLKELETTGYLKRKRKRNEKGHFKENEWLLSEQPILENRMLDNPIYENQTLINTNSNNTNLNKDNRSTDKSVDRVSEKQLKEDFEKLWKLYPRKEGKKKAFEAYKRAIKKDTTNKDIQTGIISYLKHINAQGVAKQYIKQGSTWFNGECWNDEYIVGGNSSPVNQKNSNSFAPEKRTVADLEKERRERRRDAFPIQYKNHPEWFTDEAIEDIVKEFPELREKVLEIDRARTKSDSSTT